MADLTLAGDSGAGARFSPRAVLAIGTALAVGVGGSIAGFRAVRATELERARSVLVLEARDQATAIRRELDALREQVHSLAALYLSSQRVERVEFKSFVAYILERRQSPLDLLWIERVPNSGRTSFEAAARTEGLAGFVFSELSGQGRLVPAGERAEYWVNWYVEPQQPGRTALGFDQASEPARLRELEASRDANACVLIGPLSQPAPESEMLAVLPIFDPPGAVQDVALRRQRLHGFVGAVFPLREAIEAALAAKRENGLEVRVSDASLPSGEQLLYATNLLAQPASAPDSVTSIDVPVFDRSWTVTCWRAAGSAAAAPSDWSWGVLSAGLLVTLLLALSIMHATGRATLQRMVDARTIQWQRRNHSLVEEIHEHAQAVKDLRASRARTECILDSALDALVTINERGAITGWNPKAEEVFGWVKSEVIDMPMAELIIPPEHREAHRRGLEKYLATGEGPILNRRVEITALTRDGRHIPVELSIAPFKQDDKVTFSAFLRDISARKIAERRQTEIMAELQRQLKSHSK